MIEKKPKRENTEIRDIIHKSFSNGIQSLLKRASERARERWHNLPYMWRVASLRVSHSYWSQKVRHAQNI